MKRDEAALCDLLEVTRRVMLPAKDNGTFWCEGVSPLRMCEWALSELAEVEDEIKAAQASLRKRHWTDDDDARDDDVDPSFAEATARVQDEVGDLIFDVIMLACVCERDFGLSGSRGVNSGFTLAGAAANASAKVRRRCPYSFGPRSKLGPCPDRATEEAAWADVKAMEKASRAPGGGPMPPAPPTRSSAWDRCVRRGGWMFAGSFDAALLPVAVGIGAFATGCVFGARSWR